MSELSVVVTAGGTWHAPHLALQLQRHEMLGRVFTTTPPSRFVSRVPQLNRSAITWIPWPELFSGRISTFVPSIPRSVVTFPSAHAAMFDFAVAHHIHRTMANVVVAFASFARRTLTVARERGAVGVLERGSAHVKSRFQLLSQEYERIGVKPPDWKTDRTLVGRQLEEYEIADFIAIPSSFVRETFIAHGVPASRLLITPYGVDTTRFRPGQYHPPIRQRVLSVGNLGVEKGTHLLIKALASSNVNAELHLVGTLDEYCRKLLVDSGLSFRLTPPVGQHALPELYRGASVYCLPSLQEGLSMSVLEALACGLPVIASQNTGAADVIENGVDGFIVEAGDVESMARLFTKLGSDEGLRLSVATAARRKAERYTWAAYGERLIEHYKRIAQR